MPYENEHSCRLLPPVKDAPTRRVNGKRKHDGKSYDVIFQKQKGKWQEQAYRYSDKIWSESAARSHCRSHKGILFEPASQNSQQQATGENPFIFTMPGLVEFAQTEGGKPPNKVKLTLYDGSIVKHWYWGNLAFDQKTMRMAKKRNPVLFQHDVEQRIAYSDEAVFEPKFVMEGQFLENSQIAQEIRNQMDEGFPFEASLRFDPDKSEIEHIQEDETAEVNGHKLKGPGTVIRNALIMEGSICVFGALKNTQSKAFETILKKENIMSEEITNMTLADLTAENFSTLLPEIYNQVLAKGKTETEQAGKQRFAELQKVCGDDAVLLVQCLAEGKTPADALQLKVGKLQAEAKRLTDENAALKARKLDPAIMEFSDTATPPGTGKGKQPATFMEAVSVYAAEHKCSQADAVRACASLYPELHEKMRASKGD